MDDSAPNDDPLSTPGIRVFLVQRLGTELGLRLTHIDFLGRGIFRDPKRSVSYFMTTT